MNVEAADARKTAAPAISWGSPMRRMGVPRVTAFSVSGFSQSARAKSVKKSSNGDAKAAAVAYTFKTK